MQTHAHVLVTVLAARRFPHASKLAFCCVTYQWRMSVSTMELTAAVNRLFLRALLGVDIRSPCTLQLLPLHIITCLHRLIACTSAIYRQLCTAVSHVEQRRGTVSFSQRAIPRLFTDCLGLCWLLDLTCRYNHRLLTDLLGFVHR